MVVTLPFEVGRTYRRGDIHTAFGGQRQGGISTPTRQPLIFLFTGGTGRQHGYDDGYEPDGRFRLFGEGQYGDMRMSGGNKAIRDHAKDGRDLHLFEMLDKRGNVRYLGQMVLDSIVEIPDAPDHNRSPRKAFEFMLLPISDLLGPSSTARERAETRDEAGSELEGLWTLSEDELRRRADEAPPVSAGPRVGTRSVHYRSEAVKVYVQRRAAGRCEGCGELAPFKTPEGRPYLEPHHTRRLTDGGPDSRAWVVAVCPNCHRRAHYASDAEKFNAGLKELANRLDKVKS